MAALRAEATRDYFASVPVTLGFTTATSEARPVSRLPEGRWLLAPVFSNAQSWKCRALEPAKQQARSCNRADRAPPMALFGKLPPMGFCRMLAGISAFALGVIG